MRAFSSFESVIAAADSEIGASDWLTIDQLRIDAFAHPTNDHQWIHVDPRRAATGPFGSTIAHGFLTLGLLPYFASQVLAFEGFTAQLNYGLDKVRFPSPVSVDARIRSRVRINAATTVSAGLQVVIGHQVDIDGVAKPGCVADHVVLLVT